jgi:hypothetical protein
MMFRCLSGMFRSTFGDNKATSDWAALRCDGEVAIPPQQRNAPDSAEINAQIEYVIFPAARRLVYR